MSLECTLKDRSVREALKVMLYHYILLTEHAGWDPIETAEAKRDPEAKRGPETKKDPEAKKRPQGNQMHLMHGRPRKYLGKSIRSRLREHHYRTLH